MKTVSVILPNYNYDRYISKRINEVLSQTYPISEIIILDDASTDDSVKIINAEIDGIKKKHPKLIVKTKFNKCNSGNVFSQWQKGIKMATSDYIWIAELDDSAKPNFLETAIKGFIDNNVSLSYTNSKYVNESGKIVIKDTLRKVKDSFRRNLYVYNTIPNVSAAVFKNQPELMNFLDEAKQYRLSGDWFFYIKISETGKIVYSKKTLNIHRLHSHSVTETTNLSERFSEMQKIHQYVIDNIKISSTTRGSIGRMEKQLKKKWKLV